MWSQTDITITEDDIQFYEENGYWIGPRIFNDDELEQIRQHHAAVVAGDYQTGRTPHSRSIAPGDPIDNIVKIDNAHWSDSVLAKVVLNPVVGKMATRLSRSTGTRLWHDQLLHKPPVTPDKQAGAVGWHQDYHYWQCAEPANMLTAWVALVDVTRENGCMEFVPGSHRWGLLPESDFFEQNLDALQQRIEEASGREFKTVSCELPAGAVSFHHCLTIHGSRPNMSDSPRLSMVLHLQPDGTRYKQGTPAEPHNSVRLLGGEDGDPFAGPYFPLLYSDSDPAANPWHVAKS